MNILKIYKRENNRFMKNKSLIPTKFLNPRKYLSDLNTASTSY